jgi:hypothetical protein
VSVPSDPFSERERLAVILAHDVRDQLSCWLTRRGVLPAGLLVSPFVDPSGQPSVLVRLNAPAARTLLQGLAQG